MPTAVAGASFTADHDGGENEELEGRLLAGQIQIEGRGQVADLGRVQQAGIEAAEEEMELRRLLQLLHGEDGRLQRCTGDDRP